MINTLSAETFDPLGHVVLEVLDQSTFPEMARRVSRVRTLDGGASISDGGYAVADSTITLKWSPNSQVVHEAVARLVALYSRVVVSTRGGVYLAAPEQYQPGTKESDLRLLVVAQLSS